MRFTSHQNFYAYVEKHGPVFGGSLDLSGCTGLTALPDSLSVKGRINLFGCTGLTALPDGLSVRGGLNLSGCTGLTALPDGLSVRGWLNLPDHLCGETYWRGVSVTLRNIDGFTMVMGRSHVADGITIHRTRYLKGMDVDDMPSCYVAEAGGYTAHGDTAREAVEDLQQKLIGQKDVSEIVSEIRTSRVVTRAQFRAITTACRNGLRHAMEARGLDPDAESLPLETVMQAARGDSFGERFIEAINAEVSA